jgi:nickel/cobalt transporter (NicO) family protein
MIEMIFSPIIIGLSHSVETDHLVAVGNMVSVKNDWAKESIKGVIWGIGHTVSVTLSVFVLAIIQQYYRFELPFKLELLVAIMLVGIGILRIIKLLNKKETEIKEEKKAVFFHVGLVHGLAGSGTVAVLLSSLVTETSGKLLFLLCIGLGTIIGMGLITALLTRLQFLKSSYLDSFMFSVACLSIVFGIKIFIEQIS